MADQPFWYELPKERIAQRPIHPPERARLLVVDRKEGKLTDNHFEDLPSLVGTQSHFVFNDTRVIPARLFGTLHPHGAEVELLLVSPVDSARESWICLGRPLKRIRKAERILFGDTLTGVVIDTSNPEMVTVRFEGNTGDDLHREIIRVGTMPIPPYIRGGHGDASDVQDYQSFFARYPGSVAAPTASLHFTPELVETLRQAGHEISFVTLHVGTASFQPVIVDGHLKPPAAETLHVSDKVIAEIQASKSRYSPVIAVGTTVTRALESVYTATESTTSLFIQPGYSFEFVDSLITNFHQPGTTHLLLVEAMLGRELLAKVYEHALGEGYRFLSYGDGMWVR